MARMNLFCNEVRINSVEDLWDNFNFEDLKQNISLGRLQQWLTANGFSAEHEAVLKIDLSAEDADMQIMQALKYPDEKQNAYLMAKKLQAEKAEAKKKAQAEAEANAKEESAHIAAEKTVQKEEEQKREAESNFHVMVFVKLKTIIAQETEMPESMITRVSTLAGTFDLSEFDKKRLLVTIGRKFDVTFKEEDISKIGTVGDILNLLVQKQRDEEINWEPL